jgi:HSP20 family protein
MANVSVQKVHHIETAPRLRESMKELFDRIQKGAYDLFQRRGATDGSDVEDWLRAERDVVWMPHSELVEREKEFQMKIAVLGLEAKDIQVSALPDSIIVQAEASLEEEKEEANAHFSEFTVRKLFRRFELPVAINVEQVKATLNDDMLEIVAAKAQEKKKEKSAAVTA